jgi:hypothetical protein
MARKKSQGGRPPRHAGEILRKNRTFRIRARLDDLLEAAANKAGRSVSEEIEYRLELSFYEARMAQAHLGSDVGAELLRIFYSAMVLEGIHPDWTGDRDRAENFRVAMNAIIGVFTGLRLELPPPEKRLEGLQTAKHFLLRSSKEKELSNYMEIMLSELQDLDFGEAPADEKKPKRAPSR